MNHKRIAIFFVFLFAAVLFLGTGTATRAESPGDIIVNEIMNNPAAVSDSVGEWFEVYNTTGSAIDINGWTIEDNDTDSHVISSGGPLEVPAGGYLVLGRNADSAVNGGVTLAYQYSGIDLANGADEVVLLDTALTEIDRVEYDGGPTFPDPNGASMSLIDPTLDNNVGANWCEASTPFGDGDSGTPGGANDCPTGAAPGDVIINEIMNNPTAVSDGAGEWFEVYNTTGSDIDINGWTIADNDFDSHVIDNGGPLLVPANDYLVLGNNADSGTNGGAPVAYQYSGISLGNGADEVILEDPNSGEIDRVEYDGGTAFPDPTGASMSLISPALDNNVGANWCTASTSFGAGDFGTPGGANDCPGSVQPGVVIVNEIMNNPSAVGDNEGEWFEVYNTTTGDIDINGWTIADNDGDSHLIANNGPLNVPAGGFLVLGRNADSATNGGVSVDYEYSGINLANGDDEVVLFDSTLNEVNRVEYDGGPAFPDPNGASMSLEDPALDNSVGANWCEAVTPFGDGDLGTPGSENICTLPAVPLTIMEIQGEAQVSPHLGQTVLTNGVITVVRSISFYMQDPNGDGNDATSDGILVFTGFEHSFAVGDLVEVEGNVSEFYPGGFGSGNLSTTEISNPTINLLSSGNSITPTVIGNGGRIPPNMVIEDDASGDVETQADFDPDDDGIDFYESLEGMYVQVNNAQVVGTDRFGELTVVGDNGANATILSPRGGVVIRPGDFNPERIIIDDTLILDEPDAAVGDMFAEVVGVMDYSFGNFKLFNSEPLVWIENNLPKETTTIEGSGSNVTIATFNVFNLNPGDPQAKFDELADQVVNRLNAPDVIGVQEIQDNSGPINDGVVAADQTYGLLIAAISAAGGPTYEYREVTPEDLQDGGAPGANIRVGFLFRPDRVSFIDRPGGDATTSTAPILSTDGVELTFSPGRIDPTNSAFTDSRKPIAGEFVFNNGQKVFVVVGHFNSKGGDDPLFGRVQPPTFGSEIQRHQQAAVVNSFVQDILALDPNSIVAVVGDLNDFQFSGPIQTLKGTELTNLIDTLPENEQYTYIFDGNSQVLDHILVSNNVVDKVNQVDIVHANAEYDQDLRATDHDPVVAELDLNLPPVCETSYPSQASLWPPNHEFVAVDVVVPDPDGDAVTITITSIFQDEAVDARGSGKTAPDGQGVGSPTAEVRSERVGSGNGRVYHINFIADDGQGHSCSGVVNVGVPISNDGSPAVDDGALFDSTIAP